MKKVMRCGAITMFVALSSITIAACSSSSGSAAIEAPGDAAVDTGPSTDVNCDPTLTYASFGKDFFATFCGRCHLWTQESAQIDGNTIALAAGSSTSMPPSAPFPTPDQRAQLVQWIACGAP